MLHGRRLQDLPQWSSKYIIIAFIGMGMDVMLNQMMIDGDGDGDMPTGEFTA